MFVIQNRILTSLLHLTFLASAVIINTPIGATYALRLSVEDFEFDGSLGPEGATIERADTNHFKVVLGHVPEHPTWCNRLQFQILQNSEGNQLQLDFTGSISGGEVEYLKAEAVEAVRRIQRDRPVTPSAVDSPNAKYVGIIENDTVWKDTGGNEIWCNGGHMIKERDTFYWVGYETKPKTGFRNIKLYSSTNLADWKFENNIMKREGPFSILGWAGRPGLLYNQATKQYVLIFEADSRQWERHKVGFACCDTINGSYRFVRYLYPEGNRSTGDQSVYQQDDDGYLVCTLDKTVNGKRYLNQSLAIFKLTPDYFGIEAKVYEGFDNVDGNPSIYPRHQTSREASHIIKVNETYYWFSSGLQGWNSTETKYATAKSLSGPWSELNVLATEPVSRDSYNTQHDFIIPVIGSKATTYVYVGDRYSQHHGRGVGQNVFLPLVWDNDEPQLVWFRGWTIDTATGLCDADDTPSH